MFDPSTPGPLNVPTAAAAVLEPLVAELGSVGFEAPSWTALEADGGRMLFTARLRHREALAAAEVSCWQSDGNVATTPVQVIGTMFDDGGCLVSLAQTPVQRGAGLPADWRLNQLIGATPRELWASHFRRLEREMATRRVAEWEKQPEWTRQHGQVLVDWHTHESPSPTANVVPVDSGSANLSDATTPPQLAVDPVLAEIEKQETAQSSWTTAFWILVISAALFYFSGAGTWSWEFAGWLIGILFFHESGHYVAMRLLGYRNLKMFFIPLFGAAVSGTHRDAPGWKKAVVALAGPVPGIAVGLCVGSVAIIGSQQWLLTPALLLVSLNVFNLLPILPLDGGWVMHALIFSRHPWLDAVFRMLAAILLIVVGLLGGMVVLSIIGAFMLFGVPATFRLGKLAARLRPMRDEYPTDSSGRIPTGLATRIAHELRQLPGYGTLQPKLLATQILSVFESINARPPGWLASIVLLGVYGAAWVMPLVLPVLFVLQPEFRQNIGQMAAPLPHRALRDMVDAPPRDADPPSTMPTIRVLAHFPNPGAARSALDQRRANLPDGTAVLRCGSSLLLTLPGTALAEATELEAALRPEATAGVTRSQNPSVYFEIMGDVASPQAAATVEHAIYAFAEIPPDAGGIPPWVTQPPLTTEQLRVRETLATMALARDGVPSDLFFDGNRDASGGVSNFLGKLIEHEQRSREASMAAVRARDPEEVDLPFFEEYVRAFHWDEPLDPKASSLDPGVSAKQRYEGSLWLAAQGDRWGRLPDPGDGPVPELWTEWHGSFLTRIRFGVGCAQPHATLPAICDWLAGHGLEDFTYSLEIEADEVLPN